MIGFRLIKIYKDDCIVEDDLQGGQGFEVQEAVSAAQEREA